MNGWHDLGGVQAFGPVHRSDHDDEVFHAPWEGRVFGLSLALPAQGVYNLNEFRAARERLGPEVLLLGEYYERWLGAIEHLVAARGVDAGAGDAGVERGAADLAERLMTTVRSGAPATRPAPAPPRFAVGEHVRARNVHPPGHTRAPRYARAHAGQVTALRGCMVLPDASAEGRDDVAEHLYTVRFTARELWGAGAPAKDAVCLDLWESYLEPDGGR